MKILFSNNLYLTVKVGRIILSIFCFFYFVLALLMLYAGHIFPMFIDLLLGFLYFICFFNLKKLSLKLATYLIHFVVTIYAICMVYYFSWDFGAQYYLIPSIAFCYVGEFNNKKNIYLIAIVISIIYGLLYYFTSVQHLSLYNSFIILDKNFDKAFYMLHSIVVCGVIIIMTYYIKIKTYKTIENKEEINKSLYISASTDVLTKLLNRWAFTEALALIKNAKPIHFILIDIDFFKKINDTYGHDVGDEVIKVIANCIINNFSHYTKMTSRWGGEEFLIFINGYSYSDILKICENFRKELNAYEFKKYNFKTSVSIGYLYINNYFNCSNFDKYIKEVDNLLYKAKNSGRNNIKTNI